MKKSGKCPKCASRSIIKKASVVDRGDGNFRMNLSVATYGDPRALIFKNAIETALFAWVCVDCGFTEMYAEDPGRLHKSYLEST